MPLVDRLTEEAQATGAVNTITREGKRLVGHNTDVPGFKVALDKLVGRQKMPRAAIVLGRRRRIAGGRLRPDPRGIPADHRVQPPPPSGRGARQALRPERGPHGAPGDALARVDHRGGARQVEGARQRDIDRADERRLADPGRDPPAGPARPRPDLREDPAARATPRRPAAPWPTASRCSSTRARPRSRCGPGSRRRSSLMQKALSTARAGGVRSAEGEPAGDEPRRRRGRATPPARPAPDRAGRARPRWDVSAG